jgi:hypothetical protein
MVTDPIYADLTLTGGGEVQLELPESHNVVLYVYENQIDTGPMGTQYRVSAGNAAVLGAGRSVRINAVNHDARILLLAARPLHEPVVQHGPFVMNTRAQIEQAISDFRNGQLTG